MTILYSAGKLDVTDILTKPFPVHTVSIRRDKIAVGCRSFPSFKEAFLYLSGKALSNKELKKYGWEYGGLAIREIRTAYKEYHNLDNPDTEDSYSERNRGWEIISLYILQKHLYAKKYISKRDMFQAPWLTAYVKQWAPVFV